MTKRDQRVREEHGRVMSDFIFRLQVLEIGALLGT